MLFKVTNPDHKIAGSTGVVIGVIIYFQGVYYSVPAAFGEFIPKPPEPPPPAGSGGFGERGGDSVKPIIFNAESIEAILAGRKTQTRRVVKSPKDNIDWVQSAHLDGGGNWILWSDDGADLAEFTKKAYPNGEGIVCPYGHPGDSLWVREVYALHEEFNGVQAGVIGYYWGPLYYKAHCDKMDGVGQWRSALFMPRWASRLTLHITNVRVERVQDISHDDAIAEGAQALGLWNPAGAAVEKVGGVGYRPKPTARDVYSYTWDAINAKRGYAWASNPWVWVLEFEVDNGRANA